MNWPASSSRPRPARTPSGGFEPPMVPPGPPPSPPGPRRPSAPAAPLAPEASKLTDKTLKPLRKALRQAEQDLRKALTKVEKQGGLVRLGNRGLSIGVVPHG